jgi:heme/copper-type cytochrome/quinol oxidase subunit 1
MTSIETHLPTDVSASHSAIATWLTSADHKKVGRLFIGSGLVGLVAGLVLAILVTFERINADSYQILSVDSVPQVLAAVRLLLTFGAVVPLLLGLSIAVVPLQLGARSNAFPRLAASGFWMWLTGLGLAVASIIGNGGPNGGNSDLVDLYLAGSIVLGLGVLMAATSIAVSVLTTRAPGMGILRAPLFTWSSLVGSLAVILTMPVLIGTTVYVYVDHRYARAGFGGNTGVNQWVGWALSQPFSYLLAIPALGIVLDVVPTIGRTRLAQRSAAFGAIGVVAVSALAVVTQTSITLPWEGEKFFDNAGTKIADLLPFLLLNVVPILGLLGVLGLALLTLKSAKPSISAPLTFVLIGLLGILLGAAAHIVGLVEDAGLIGSVYEAGVYVPITFGAIAIAFGGICFWGPKLWGRSISDKAATPLALLALLAIGLDSIPYFVAGFADQPASLVNGFSYSGPQDLWNALTCAGFVVMLLASIAFIGLALKSFTSGAVAGNDPWDGSTLEWATSSPPPENNFAGVIVVNSATPLADTKSASSTGKVA